MPPPHRAPDNEMMGLGQIRREIGRRFYVLSRTARAAAFRLAYLAYTRMLACVGQQAPTPAAARSMRERLERLLDEDYRDAESGYYPRALIRSLPWLEYAGAAPRLLADVPKRRALIRRADHRALPHHADEARYPSYYARNFHFQTEGYLGDESAALYDLQVEMLFVGAADAMRRRLIRPLVQFARAQERQQPLRVLDVACGTGHLLRMLGASLGNAELSGLDLSPHYLARARRILPGRLGVSLVCDNAEQLPFGDGEFDAVTNVYLMHEVPDQVRARILEEMARVVRPGGLVVVADSIQMADAPELRELLQAFAGRYHEPYYLDYVSDDLAARMRSAGLEVIDERTSFVSKVVTAERPRQRSTSTRASRTRADAAAGGGSRARSPLLEMHGA
jgi:ubiquinone/menaquinone biosynthesis C-methylase UbiE